MIFDLLAAQWAHESLLRVTGGKNRYEYMYPGLPLMADMARSAFPFSEPIYIGEHALRVRAIPCSAVAQQRQKIIRNGVALAGEESVSVGHQRHPPPVH